jgi:hypothetical protein
MSTGQELRDYATELDDKNQQRQVELERELSPLKTKAAQIQAAIDALGGAHQRFTNYKVEVGGNYQCPSCWIKLEKESVLTPIRGGTNTMGFLECSNCHETFSFRFDVAPKRAGVGS